MLHVHCYSKHRYYEPVYIDHVVFLSCMLNNIRYTVIKSNTIFNLTIFFFCVFFNLFLWFYLYIRNFSHVILLIDIRMIAYSLKLFLLVAASEN